MAYVITTKSSSCILGAGACSCSFIRPFAHRPPARLLASCSLTKAVAAHYGRYARPSVLPHDGKKERKKDRANDRTNERTRDQAWKKGRESERGNERESERKASERERQKKRWEVSKSGPCHESHYCDASLPPSPFKTDL